MKRTLMGLLIVALLVGAASADPFIGNTLRYSIDIKDGCDITALGDTDVNLGTGDLTTTGAGSFGTMTTSGATTGAGATYTGMVQAEHLYSTDDINCTDDIDVGDDLRVVGLATIGETLTLTGIGTFIAQPIFRAGALVWDDQKLYFGNDSDGSIEYDENGDNEIKTTGTWDFDGVLKTSSTSEFGGAATFLAPPVINVAGVAPLSVVSEYWVEHLNADLLDNQTGAYYGTAANQTSQQTEIDACEVNATNQQNEIDLCEVNATSQQTAIDACEDNATIQQNAIDALELETYLHVQVITDPIVAAADTIEGATTIDTTGFTLAAVDLDAQPDVARTLSVTPNGELTGWVLFEGTNIDDEAITEYVNFSASSSLADTTKAFKTLTQVTGAKTAGDDRSITIGQTDELGLDMTIDNDYQIMMVKFDGGIDATQTLVKDGTDVELNNIDVAGTLNGAKTIWVYVIVE